MRASTINPVSIARCDPAIERDALALAAQAWPQAEAAAYARSIAAAIEDGQASRVVLLAARHDRGCLAAQIAQQLPGGTAIVWAPQFAATRGEEEQAGLDENATDALAAELFARLELELSQGGTRLAQALSPAGDSSAERLFPLGNFAPGADLLYLTAEAETFPNQPPALPFELVPFAQTDGERLACVLERTYAGTLDCPGFDGLRPTADVIAGYQAVGQFQASLWHFVRDAGEDVGCLLVSLHPDVNHAELVYVGLAPEVRGRNWGLALARHAQWLARSLSAQRLVLAVDAANWPALRLYETAGFVSFDRRRVWLRQLSRSICKVNADNSLRHS